MNKIHYYDGYFYKKFIDPRLNGLRLKIISQIMNCKKFLDIGCGTGALAIEASKFCEDVYGIDLSSKMIETANETKNKLKLNNVNFFHGGIEILKNFYDKSFDYVVFSMSLHEMDEVERLKILKESLRVSKQVIIADYNIPALDYISDLGVIFIEFIAGINHFRNYLSFRKSGGINNLIVKTEAKVLYSEHYSSIFSIYLISKD